MVGYFLGPHAGGDSWGLIVVLFNAQPQPIAIKLCPGRWGRWWMKTGWSLNPSAKLPRQWKWQGGLSGLVDLNSITEG